MMKIKKIMKNFEENKADFYKKMLAEEEEQLRKVRKEKLKKEQEDGSQKI